jgi:hypothetical protein
MVGWRVSILMIMFLLSTIINNVILLSPTWSEAEHLQVHTLHQLLNQKRWVGLFGYL